MENDKGWIATELTAERLTTQYAP